jgi:hypothetical protein
MCNPAILAVAGAVATAGGQVVSGIYASQMAGYRAQVAQQNQQLARDSAQSAIERGQEEQRRLGRETAQRVGSQRARMAANGLDVGFGSADRVTGDTRLIASEDAQTIDDNTRRQVRAMQIDAWNFESEKRAAQAERRSIGISTAFSVAGTALGGATQYADFRSRRGAVPRVSNVGGG